MKLKYKDYYKVAGIYKIINNIDGKFYIGSSVNLYNRSIAHNKMLLSNNHDNQYLQNAFNKYKGENFTFEILEVVNDNTNLRKLEYKYILDLKPDYNITNVNLNHKLKLSEETKKKIGIKSSEKFIKNPKLKSDFINRVKATTPWNKGKRGVYTNEQLRNLSNKAKIRREKQIASNGPFSGKPMKKLLQYDKDMNFIKEWNSLSDASSFYKAKNCGNFTTACKKGIKLYNSYWKYK